MGVWNPGPGATGGDDTYLGDGTDEIIDGLAGNDILDGGGGSDTLNGGDNDDIIRPGDDYVADTVSGGNGYDILDYSSLYLDGVIANLAMGRVHRSFWGDTTGETVSGIEEFRGTQASDLILGVGGDPNIVLLRGGSGNDMIRPETGQQAEGGAGADVFSVVRSFTILDFNVAEGDRLSGTAVTAMSLDGADTLLTIDGNTVRIAGINNLTLGQWQALNDLTYEAYYPNGGNDSEVMSNASDWYFGGDGNDTIQLSGGNNIAMGGRGDDQLGAYAGVDRLEGGSGNDAMWGGDGNDFLMGEAGDDWFIGEGGIDTASYARAQAGVTATLMITGVAQNTIGEGNDVFLTIENLEGSAFDDTLTGDANANVLTGLDGADTLNGGDGGDTINGDGGNDELRGANGVDVLNGGDGNDVLHITENDSSDALNGGSGDDVVVVHGSGTWSDFSMVGRTINSIDAFTFDSTAGTAHTITFAATQIGAGVSANATITGATTGVRSELQFMWHEAFTLSLAGFQFVNWGSNDSVFIYGSGGNDQIAGSSQDDDIRGDAGDDVISGGGGSDTIFGGLGADVFNGGDGADYLYADQGDDTLNGDAGNDLLFGGSGLNHLRGGDGADEILVDSTGAPGSTYDGGSGVDVVRVFGSSVVAFENSTVIGIERLRFDGDGPTLIANFAAAQLGGGISSALQVTGSFFADTVRISAGLVDTFSVTDFTFVTWSANDVLVLQGNGNSNVLTGSSVRDHIIGIGGDDTLNGGGGDDVLNGGLGADALNGGDGNDWASYENAASGLTVDLSNIAANTGEAAGDIYASIELLRGSAFNDTLIGNFLANVLNGGGGDDLLVGGAGADTLAGAAGFDTASYAASSAGVTVDLETGTGLGGDAQGDTLTAVEALVGSAHNDVLIGRNYTNNTLNGGAGDDTIEGGYGADTLIGGDGVDTLDYSGSLTGVDVRLFNGAAAGGQANGDTHTGFENIRGSDTATDILAGNEVANWIWGGGGNETINGRDGNDYLFGEAGNDTVLGGVGEDVLAGSIGNDTLGGGADDDTVDYSLSDAGVTVNLATGVGAGGWAQGDTLVSVENVFGSAFDDVIIGKANFWDNLFDGGGGNDTLTGGNGNDVFVFRMGDGSDIVTDFVAGAAVVDRVQITGWGAAFDTFAELQAIASQQGADTVFDFGNGQTLTLNNVTLANLNANDFLFA